MIAEPTITPSEIFAIFRACSGVEIPPAAAVRAEVVEMLKLWALSPPVPTISKTFIIQEMSKVNREFCPDS